MQENKGQNRAFQEMRKVALKRLEGKSAEEIAERTGIFYDQSQKMFVLNSLGQKIQIQYPKYEILPELNEWHHLLLLHYLDMADGVSLTEELMTFGNLPDGMVRGGGFDRQSERILSQRLGNGTADQIGKVCENLGGQMIPSNADLCMVFYFFPFYPITVKLWFADEEIPGSGRLLLDKSAGHYLSVEDAVTAGTLLLENLLREYENLC